MKALHCLITLCFSSITAFTQSVGIGTETPHSSALLELSSNSKGLLLPRLTTAQRGAITPVAEGLMVYDTDLQTPMTYTANGWALSADNLGNHTATMPLILGTNPVMQASGGARLNFSSDGTLRYRAIQTVSQILGDRFRVDNNGGLVALGELGVGTIPQTGPGTRMMFHPYKAAFRTGGAQADEWDEASVGFYSTALGWRLTASGNYSFAGGDNNGASGATAFTYGQGNNAAGALSVALGSNCTTAGTYALAMGRNNRAVATSAVAIGSYCSSTMENTVSLGYRAAAKNTGAMVLNDASNTDSLISSASNQFNSRFAGGYRLYTNAAKTIGVSLAASGNSWATISDSSLKENFIKADGESFLQRVKNLRLGSWNYKAAPESSQRHYGAMAQEFFAQYGNDLLGTIGNDTTIASADLDGIVLILLQALEQRTTSLQEQNNQLSKQLLNMQQQYAVLQSRMENMLAGFNKKAEASNSIAGGGK